MMKLYKKTYIHIIICALLTPFTILGLGINFRISLLGLIVYNIGLFIFIGVFKEKKRYLLLLIYPTLLLLYGLCRILGVLG